MLGSNLGDRQANIRSALRLLEIALGCSCKAVSPVMETKACGFEGPDFLNLAVRFETRVQPFPLLKVCKMVERNLGRTDEVQYAPDGSRVYHDRVIDIDILYYGKRRIEGPELTIPHPQVESREFVKELLAKLEEVC